MILSVEEISNALTAAQTGMNRGRLMMLHQKATSHPYTAAHVNLIRELLDRPAPQPAKYRHPEDDARRILIPAKPGGDTTHPLTESDRAWIASLPSPSLITYDDAVQLARMAAQVPAKSGDDLLVTSKWAPVKARHDKAKADAELAATRQPLPQIDRATAERALHEAIAAATTELDDAEQSYRAARMYDDLMGTRQGHHDQAHNAAVQRVRELEDAEVDRQALTRPADAVA